MNFTLSHEQQLLQDSAARFVREHGRFEDWQKACVDKRAYIKENWQKMAELGWLAISVPEDLGGLGGSAIDTMVLMEQFGKGLAREPYVSTCIIGSTLLQHACSEIKEQRLNAIMMGECRIALGLGEPLGHFNLEYVEMTAKAQSGRYQLSGEKSHVPDGSTADWYILPARTSGAVDDPDGITLFLVSANALGLVRKNFRSPDQRHVSSLVLHNVAVSDTAVIGTIGGGLALLEMAVDHAIAASLAEALGIMEAACSVTLDYLKTRQQFGVTIGSFQVLQHRMVDMVIACEEARSMTYYATENLSSPSHVRTRAISAAKTRVGQNALFVGQQAIQLHGGIGTSDEHIVSHYLKRLVMFELSFGNIDFHRQRYASLGTACSDQK
ncbi:acyl-CoA dehydrogenase [Glaciimonas sp. CA11.2]|uniref:acyl-CoA dehydrogenase family protein n=1 Tax=Glaciimonas sp. CA11.2 TaxID=3048601 RepID=UPI002AB37A9D|nr:acyl-CoA dehydrogenase [Glaciimonas sp. CA11.2]MDY7547717.1 acyl-CoA dehydrogenase [Glaciimonas sp. CA11.2]MEB0161366.1 acyl-CoA dehydrogenase [Glaciimonas sp. CA11.2]